MVKWDVEAEYRAAKCCINCMYYHKSKRLQGSFCLNTENNNIARGDLPVNPGYVCKRFRAKEYL